MILQTLRSVLSGEGFFEKDFLSDKPHDLERKVSQILFQF